MTIESLDQLLLDQMQDVYDAEKQIVKALPKLAKAASSEDLRETITEHLEATRGHVERLEKAFENLGTKAKSKTCAGMKGLIEESEEVIGQDASGEMKDLAIIAAAQRVEHYEIAAYGVIRTLAERLDNEEVAELFQETLGEEEAADERLTEVAEMLMEGVSQEEAMEEGEEGAEIEEETGTKTRRSSGM